MNVKILLAQFVNFAVLIFVLWRFAYKPVLKLLEDRRAKIAQGVKDSEESEIKLKEAEEKKKEIIAESRKEANAIIEEAKSKAEVKYQEIINKSKGDLRAIIEDEKEKIANEKKLAMAEVKKKTAELVILAIEKVLAEKIDEKKDAELIARVVKEL